MHQKGKWFELSSRCWQRGQKDFATKDALYSWCFGGQGGKSGGSENQQSVKRNQSSSLVTSCSKPVRCGQGNKRGNKRSEGSDRENGEGTFLGGDYPVAIYPLRGKKTHDRERMRNGT